MNEMTLGQTNEQTAAVDEKLAAGPELTAEEMADDQLGHLLLTAWTSILEEDLRSE